MFKLRKLGLKKKGVSEVVAYVLLIVISLSLATLVFNWLKSEIPKDTEIDCDENVALNIRDYNYSCSTNPQQLNVTLQNKGYFNAAGFIARVHNKSGAELGLYVIEVNNQTIETGDLYFFNVSSPFNDFDNGNNITGRLTFIEFQPYQIKDGEKFLCKDFISKAKLTCR